MIFQFSSVQSLSRGWLFVTPWTAAGQASLSIINSQSPPKPLSIESVMPSKHLSLFFLIFIIFSFIFISWRLIILQYCSAIQPSHPQLSPSPPALNLSQHQGLFKWVSSSNQVAKILEFQLQHQSFQWTPRTDLL